MIPYTPPAFNKAAFNCPHCKAFADQQWSDLITNNQWVEDLRIAYCNHCKKYSLWVDREMIYPEPIPVDSPNDDLPAEIKEDYEEAAQISEKSPRGAAALLRLAIQKLCKELGEDGKNINTDIANLVKKGLPVRIQQALDIVRVTGNEAVHPGVLDLKDDQETARNLFKLVNFIAEKMITEPKEVGKIFETLPETKKEEIKKRDS